MNFKDLISVYSFWGGLPSDEKRRVLFIIISTPLILYFSSILYMYLEGDYRLIDLTSQDEWSDFIGSGRIVYTLFIFIVIFFLFNFVLTIILELFYNLIITMAKYFIRKRREKRPKNSKNFFESIYLISFDSDTQRFKFLLNLQKKAFEWNKDMIKTLYPFNSKKNVKDSKLLFIFLIFYFIGFNQILIQSFSFPTWGIYIVNAVMGYMVLSLLLVSFLQQVLYKYGGKIIYDLERINNYMSVESDATSSFHVDKPILTTKQNMLPGRTEFSSVLRDSITKYNQSDCLVIGVLGKWGEGKSSVVNMALSELVINSDVNSHHVLYFNPWNFENSSFVIQSFLVELKKELIKLIGNEEYEETGSRLDTYIDLISGKPEANDIEGDVFESIGNLKEEIDKQLATISSKIIVVIDELDRLSGNEIKMVFKLVKSIGSFSNLIYVIPFDKAYVIDQIKDDTIGDQYLKKIFQIQIELPPVSYVEMYEVLTKSLVKYSRSSGENGLESNAKWKKIFQSGLRDYFQNLRDVYSFLNSLDIYMNLKAKDLDDLDFIAIVAIKLFDPQLYDYIGNNRNGYLFPWDQMSEKNQSDSSLSDRRLALLKDSFELSIIKNKISFDEFIYALFPGFKNKLKTSTEEIRKYRIKGYICSPLHFSQFLFYPLSEKIITNNELELILESSNDFDSFTEKLKNLIQENKAHTFLDRLEDYIGDQIVADNCLNILLGLLQSRNDFVSDRKVFDFSGQTYVGILISLYEMHFLSPGSIDEVKWRAVFNSENVSIGNLMLFFLELSEHRGVYMDKQNNYRQIFGNARVNDEIGGITKLLLTRLENLDLIKIIESEHVGKILFWWNKLDSTAKLNMDEIKSYLESNVKSLISFLERIRQTDVTFVYGKGNVITYYFSIDSYIKDFMDISYLYSLCKKSLKSNDNDILQLFIDCVEGKINPNLNR